MRWFAAGELVPEEEVRLILDSQLELGQAFIGITRDAKMFQI